VGDAVTVRGEYESPTLGGKREHVTGKHLRLDSQKMLAYKGKPRSDFFEESAVSKKKGGDLEESVDGSQELRENQILEDEWGGRPITKRWRREQDETFRKFWSFYEEGKLSLGAQES